MLNLSKEQLELLQASLKKHADEKAKMRVSELDKTLDTAVAKLAVEGWTLPVELPITELNKLGNTNELDDVNLYMEQFYTCYDYRNMKAMIKGIQKSKIKAGLIKVVNECWNAFNSKMYAICATSLISVIEGILSEFSDDKKDIRMKKYVKNT